MWPATFQLIVIHVQLTSINVLENYHEHLPFHVVETKKGTPNNHIVSEKRSLGHPLSMMWLRICAPMTCEAHHEVAMDDMTSWYKSMDDLELVNTKGHKCRENVTIWGGYCGFCGWNEWGQHDAWPYQEDHCRSSWEEDEGVWWLMWVVTLCDLKWSCIYFGRWGKLEACNHISSSQIKLDS